MGGSALISSFLSSDQLHVVSIVLFEQRAKGNSHSNTTDTSLSPTSTSPLVASQPSPTSRSLAAAIDAPCKTITMLPSPYDLVKDAGGAILKTRAAAEQVCGF